MVVASSADVNVPFFSAMGRAESPHAPTEPIQEIRMDTEVFVDQGVFGRRW